VFQRLTPEKLVPEPLKLLGDEEEKQRPSEEKETMT